MNKEKSGQHGWGDAEKARGNRIENNKRPWALTQQTEALYYHEDMPFLYEIMITPVPKEFSSVKMKMYDGTTDPNDHIA